MLKNEEIRNIVKEKIKGNLIRICASIFFINFLSNTVLLPLDSLLTWLLDMHSSNILNIISLLVSLLIGFINVNITSLLIIIFLFKTLKGEKNIKVFSPLKNINKCLSFLGFCLYFYIRMFLWALLPILLFIPLIIPYTMSSFMSSPNVGNLSTLLFCLSIILLIITAVFLLYKTLSYFFAVFIYLDIEDIPYSKAIDLSVYMTKNEILNFIKFNLKNILKLGLIPFIIVTVSVIVSMPGFSLFLILFVLYIFFVLVPYLLVMNTEYYFQLKEHKKITERL